MDKKFLVNAAVIFGEWMGVVLYIKTDVSWINWFNKVIPFPPPKL